MSKVHDHLLLANKNHEALQVLLSGGGLNHSEWITTIAFYKAAQVIEAILVTKGKNSTSHDARRKNIRAFLRSEPLLQHHNYLFNASKIARYLHDEQGVKYTNFSSFLPAHKTVEKIITGRLIPIEQISKQYLSEQSYALLKKSDSFVIPPTAATLAPLGLQAAANPST